MTKSSKSQAESAFGQALFQVNNIEMTMPHSSLKKRTFQRSKA